MTRTVRLAKKLAAGILAAVMVFLLFGALLPAAQEAHADGNRIAHVDLTYDAAAIDLNTAWTEGEVDRRVYDNAAENTTGCHLSDSQLLYLNEEYYCCYGIGDGTNQVRTDRIYGINYYIRLDEGYDWIDDVKPLTEYQPSATGADCPNFTVTVNGVARTDYLIQYGATYHTLDLFIPLPTASTTPIVTGVSIEGNDLALDAGSSHAFSATVTGTVTNKSVNWSVEGASSTSTRISSEGVLTLGADETAETVTVRATAAADAAKSDTRTVTVLQDVPTIDSVTVTPNQNVSVFPGGSIQFEVNVEGTQTDKSVTWSIIGEGDPNTAITQDGYLTVGWSELTPSVSVIARANQDPSKYAQVSVTIEPLTYISHVDLTYDAAAIDLSTSWTEGAVGDRVYDHTGENTTGCHLSEAQFLYLDEENFCRYGIGDGSRQVSADRRYGLNYVLYPDDGYDWIGELKPLTAYQPSATSADCPNFSVTLNGVEQPFFLIQYSPLHHVIDLWIPIPLSQYDVSGADVTGMAVRTFNGSAQTQSPTVRMTIDGAVRTLTAGTDYTLSYENNVKPGIGTMIITGTGAYSGVASYPFRIQFKDVTDPSQFYYDAVYWGTDNGVIAGWDDGTFRPDNTCNRASVVTFLWRMRGCPEPSSTAAFSDMTGNETFDAAISWAVEQGITTGWADNTFRPWNTCNRASIVTFLWRFAGKPEPAAPGTFADMTSNEEFNQAIAWAAEQGITTGWPDGTFRPWNDCSRLAVASFLYRYDQLP
ncbi:MAG: S-layer homology domain-containing protein [Lachnospiraceae bacterium]|nr:S-layer homology domain-containing protein [Lachnospiraceae bacterium]